MTNNGDLILPEGQKPEEEEIMIFKGTLKGDKVLIDFGKDIPLPIISYFKDVLIDRCQLMRQRTSISNVHTVKLPQSMLDRLRQR